MSTWRGGKQEGKINKSKNISAIWSGRLLWGKQKREHPEPNWHRLTYRNINDNNDSIKTKKLKKNTYNLNIGSFELDEENEERESLLLCSSLHLI